ncbi:MAG: hypothetical protein JNM07_11115 [Phycisphaerae bacterium]|nr:hypothetical protein [Phycisphaerae bacterium]
MNRRPLAIVALAALTSVTGLASAQTNLSQGITYQGRLTDGGASPTAQYDLQFRVFDALVAGAQQGPTLFFNNQQVVNGLFTVNLDFGDIFDGDERFLQIEVRPFNSGGAFTILNPRQRLSAAPYALGLRLPYTTDRNLAGSGLFDISNAGTARVGLFSKTSTASFNSALRVESADNFPALYAIGQGTTSAGALRAETNSSSTARAGQFFNLNSSNANAALYANTLGTGPAMHADGRLQVGTGGTTLGSVQVFGNVGTTPIADITDLGSGQGGRIRVYEDNGAVAGQFETDANGTGSFFRINRGTNQTGFSIDGNSLGTNEPSVTINGSTRSMQFQPGAASGNASVVLPTDAISATEILDEPGVASNTSNGLVTGDGTIQTLLSRTITAPAAGFVLVIGSCQANMLHTNGTTDSATFGVSDSATAFPANQDVGLLVSSTLPTGNFITPVSVHGLFSVNAGANTFFFLYEETGGASSVNDMQLSCVYFPTAYGTVTGTFFAPDGANDKDPNKHRPAYSAADILAEREQGRAFNQQRLAAEFARMEAEMVSLRKQLDAATAGQNEKRDVKPTKKADPIPVEGQTQGN